jgi:hypothetical protein
MIGLYAIWQNVERQRKKISKSKKTNVKSNKK